MAKFKKGDYVIRIPEKDYPNHQDDDEYAYGVDYDDFASGTILKVVRPFTNRFWAKSPFNQSSESIDSAPWFLTGVYINLDCKAFRKIRRAEAISHML